ncbi:MAG: hypothetical protein RLZZ299_606 [Pseudomonadota bacterium]
MPLEHDVCVEDVTPGDPHAQDEGLPGGRPARDVHDTWTLFGVEIPPTRRAEAEADFERMCVEVLEGRRAWHDPALRGAARALKVDGPPRHDRRPPLRVGAREIPDSLLAEVTEDFLPDVGVLVPRVLGLEPWDVGPDAHRVAAAVLCFVPATEDGRRPLDRWMDEDGRDREEVRAAHALDAYPPGVFVDGVPWLPRPPRWCPTGPAPRGVVVARPWRVDDGDTSRPWRWSMVLPLPAAPDRAVLARRLVLELWRARVHERRMSVEDLLRARPEVLVRAACEGARAR